MFHGLLSSQSDKQAKLEQKFIKIDLNDLASLILQWGQTP